MQPGPDFARIRARLAEMRADGVSFAEAWPRVSGGPTAHYVLIDTADAWRRAYEGEPARPAEVAAAALMGMGNL
jgi:hypothetical protein